MRTILALIRKEFLQLRRNTELLPLITVVPLMQVILLSFAANYEFENLNMAVWDQDKSVISQRMAAKYLGSGYFRLVDHIDSQAAADDLLFREKADIILVIPADFDKKYEREGSNSVQFQVNAINNMKGGIARQYAMAILQDYTSELREERLGPQDMRFAQRIFTTTNYWYNPDLNYKTIMVPGILAEIVCLLIMVLSAMNIVREKEMGTIEQLNVTPIKKHEFIMGKLIPFWIIGHGIFWLGMLFGKLIFDFPIEGNLLLMEAFLAVFLFVPLGFGFFISTLAGTQQQALFISFFFVIVFILMCGLFTPVEAMPQWAQDVNIINPMAYIVEVNRLVLLKGSGLDRILPVIGGMALYAVLIIGLAVLNYRKTS
jgi:ABC-2 type transport system permease protein